MNDYELRQLFGVVKGGIKILRANQERLTDGQRGELAGNFTEAPAAPQPTAAPAADAPSKGPRSGRRGAPSEAAAADSPAAPSSPATADAGGA